jgi:hypothetical protein
MKTLTRRASEGELPSTSWMNSPSLARFEVALFWICPLSPEAGARGQGAKSRNFKTGASG